MVICDELDEFLDAEGGQFVISTEELISQVSFPLMQVLNFFFDGVFSEQVVDGHWFILTQPVRPVGSLVFNGWIPPGVQVDDIVRLSQVQTQRQLSN